MQTLNNDPRVLERDIIEAAAQSSRLVVGEDGRMYLDDVLILGSHYTPDEYRADGWSSEATEFGGRSHSAIDNLLEEFSNGDKHERRVAEEAERFFVFNPNFDDMKSKDEAAAELARHGWSNQMIMARWMKAGGGFSDIALDMRIPLPPEERDPKTGSHYHWPQKHAVVYADRAGDESVLNRFPSGYLAALRSRVEFYRDGRDELFKK
jgi:hypothetical protein